jgi:hypothetical protein
MLPPNGLELSCPAEAGNATRTLGQGGGQDKHHRKRRPPGQLQRVVRPPEICVLPPTLGRSGNDEPELDALLSEPGGDADRT